MLEKMLEKIKTLAVTLNITGEISKKETGLLTSVIVMATATAVVLEIDKDSFIVILFGFITFILALFFVALVVFRKDD